MKKTIVIAVVMSCAVARAFVADVRAYGAKGDGVTDDTAAIQRAIDAVDAAGGGKVYFPYTTNGYLVASPGRETDAEGLKTTYTYDALGRVIAETKSGGGVRPSTTTIGKKDPSV